MSTIGLEAMLKTAAELRTQLSDASDELNKTIDVVEQSLRALKLGVTAKVQLLEYDDGSSVHLSFHREGSDWGLYVQEVSAIGELEEPVPLKKASRNARIVSAGRFESLLVALIAEMETELHSVQTSISKGREIAGVIEASGLQAKAGKK